MFKKTINVPFDVTDRLISDLLCLAFEGGSSYWAEFVEQIVRPGGTETEFNSDALAAGNTLRVYYDDEGNMNSLPLTNEDMAEAIGLAALNRPRVWLDIINDNMDADTGDIILQLALFGEVIYG